MKRILSRQGLASLALLCWALACGISVAAEPASDYLLAPGDAIRIQVFQHPDLSLETRLSEAGTISYPLVGNVAVGGSTIAAAEQRLAAALRDGRFVKAPQVNIVLVQVRGNQISVLGQVNRPGRYPVEAATTRLSEMIAIAGGVGAAGADVVVVTGVREGRSLRREIDLPALYLDGRLDDDIAVVGGDTIYVHLAPVFYIYGEVQRPGPYRVARHMTVQQALVTGGGPTLRGTERDLRLQRRGADGKLATLSPELSDPVFPDDVLLIRERLF